MTRNSGNGCPPWSTAGGPDPDFADGVRETHHWALTGTDLLDSFRGRFPQDERADYDVIIRCLGYIWDCPHDDAASVVGYRCPACGRTRAVALSDAQLEPQRAANVAYVRRLCWTFAERGVDAMLELVPPDVEWIPQLAAGRVLHGSEELRAFLAERAPQSRPPQPAEIAPVGDHVLVRFEWPGPGPRALWSVYLFEDGQLVRAISFDQESFALDATAQVA